MNEPAQKQGLSRRERLSLDRDFQAVFKRRQGAAGRWLVVYGRPNGLPFNRLGLTVGRKLGGAVVRNSFKRRVREAFRLSKHRQPQGWDWVVLPLFRKGESESAFLTESPGLSDLCQELEALTSQLGTRTRRSRERPRENGEHAR